MVSLSLMKTLAWLSLALGIKLLFTKSAFCRSSQTDGGITSFLVLMQNFTRKILEAWAFCCYCSIRGNEYENTNCLCWEKNLFTAITGDNEK